MVLVLGVGPVAAKADVVLVLGVGLVAAKALMWPLALLQNSSIFEGHELRGPLYSGPRNGMTLTKL